MIEYLILNVIGVSILTVCFVWYFTRIFVGNWKRVKKKFNYYMDYKKNPKESIIFWVITVLLFASFWFEFFCIGELVSRF